MVDESDNPVLVLLRGLRADMDQVKTKLGQVDIKLEKMDATLDSLKFQMTYTFGAAGIANVNAQQADTKAAEALERQKKTETRRDEFERRLQRVEETGQR